MDDITSIKKAKYDSEEFKKLEEKHIKMIMKIINSFNLDWGDYSINKEDLKQEALIGLYEACENFDPKYNVKFSTFAYQVMRRRVNRAYQKMKNIYDKETYSYSKFEKDDRSETFATKEKEDNPKENLKVMDICTNAYYIGGRKLSELDYSIISKRLENKTYKEIAEELNISPKRVDNRLVRIKRRLAKKIKEHKQDD